MPAEGALWLFLRLLRRVDWPVVWDATTSLRLWEALVLLGIVVGNMTATITPPPADIVIRSAMFHSWNIEVARGLAGLVLNTVFFYIGRFAALVFGFLLMWAIFAYDETFAWTAFVSGLSAVGIGAALALMRCRSAAAATGRWAGRTLQRIRAGWPGPDELETRFTDFRNAVADTLQSRWPQVDAAAGLQLVVESVLLVAAGFGVWRLRHRARTR